MLDKYGVTLPLECPLHAARDVFAQQEAAKIHVPPQWTCGLCGKAFYHEAHLDRHLDNRHEDYLNNVRSGLVTLPALPYPTLLTLLLANAAEFCTLPLAHRASPSAYKYPLNDICTYSSSLPACKHHLKSFPFCSQNLTE